MFPTARRARTLWPLLGLAVLLAGSAARAQPWRASVLALPRLAAAAGDSSAATGDSSATRPVLSLRPGSEVAPPVKGQPSIIGPIAGGLAAATLGAFLGTAVGDASDHDNSDFIPTGAVAGFLIGEALFLPIGVHLGNGRRGSFSDDLGASLLGGMGALGIGAIGSSGAAYLAGLGTQVVFTVWAERHYAARKQRAAAAEAARRALRGGVMAPAPPPEPEPLVPPPPPTK